MKTHQKTTRELKQKLTREASTSSTSGVGTNMHVFRMTLNTNVNLHVFRMILNINATPRSQGQGIRL